MIRIQGELEIDADRGVVYFHNQTGTTVLRINQLPNGPRYLDSAQQLVFVDITWGYGVNWQLAQTLP